jgi:hypothetical protein
MSLDVGGRVVPPARAGLVVLAALALLAVACSRTPVASGAGTAVTSIEFSGYAAFRSESGQHPDADLETRVPALGAGPAGDDELTLRVAPQAAADAGVRFTAGGGGEVFALELRGSRGVLWTGVFPVEPDGLESRLRGALATLRFGPPAGR